MKGFKQKDIRTFRKITVCGVDYCWEKLEPEILFISLQQQPRQEIMVGLEDQYKG